MIGYRCRVVQRTHAAIQEVKAYKARVFEVGVVFMVEVSKLALNIADVSEEPIHDVDEVAKLCKERAAVEVFGALPAACFVVTLIAVPVAIELHHIDISQHFALNDIFDPDTWWRVAVLHHAKNLLVGLQGGINDLLTAFFAEAHWFFTNHMLARLKSFFGLLGV